jgi:hypothetical protein
VQLSHFPCPQAPHFSGALTVRFADLQSSLQQSHVPDIVEFWLGRSNTRRTRAGGVLNSSNSADERKDNTLYREGRSSVDSKPKER